MNTVDVKHVLPILSLEVVNRFGLYNIQCATKFSEANLTLVRIGLFREGHQTY